MKKELTLTSDTDKAVLIGVVIYISGHQQADCQCRPFLSTQAEKRTYTVGSVYYDAYRNGCALGEYNIDAELAKKAETGDVSAIETLETRKQERTVKDLRNQLFGI